MNKDITIIIIGQSLRIIIFFNIVILFFFISLPFAVLCTTKGL